MTPSGFVEEGRKRKGLWQDGDWVDIGHLIEVRVVINEIRYSVAVGLVTMYQDACSRL